MAQYICDLGLVDEVWFMVSPQNPLKKDSELLDEDARLELVELAVQNHPQLKASDFEFHLPRPSYTYITLGRLEETFPDIEFSLIIGGDNWSLFPKWRNSDYILSHYPIIVYPREGQIKQSGEEQEETVFISDEQPHFLKDAPLFPISSTEIRKAIQKGEDVSEWVDKAVLQEIRRKKYYE